MKMMYRGRLIKVDDESGSYYDEHGLLCNVQGDSLEEQRNEKRKQLGLTYVEMETECSPEECRARIIKEKQQ